MKFVNTVIVLMILGVVAGILVQFYAELSIALGLLMTLFFGVALILLRSRVFFVPRGHLLFGVCIWAAFVGVGIFRSATVYASDFDINKTQTYRAEIFEKSYETERKIAYKALVYSLVEGKSANAELVFPKDSITAAFSSGETLLFQGEKILSSKNTPYEFDYQTYLKKQGIPLRISVEDKRYRILSSSNGKWRNFRSLIRRYIEQKLREHRVPEQDIAMTQALLLGVRDEIPQSVYQNYVNSGGVHLLAISGLHIGVITSILMFLLRVIRGRYASKIRMTIVVLLLWGYAFCVGFPPSVIRAVTMFSLIAINWYLRRGKTMYDGALLALLLLLLIHPQYIFSVGFQLSFSAVFSILIVFPLLKKIGTPQPYLLRQAVLLIYVSVSAQLGVLPISLYYFHQFPVLFLVTNILLLPVMTLVLSLGIMVVVLSCLDFLPELVQKVYHAMILYMNSVSEYIAMQEHFLIRHIYFDEFLMLFSWGIIISGIFLLRKRTYANVKIFLLSIWLFQIVWIVRQYQEGQKESFYILNNFKNSFVIHRNGRHLTSYSDTLTAATSRVEEVFRNALPIDTISRRKMPSIFQYKGKTALVIDEKMIVPEKYFHVDLILLCQSPKINLERLIERFSPEVIVADATNFAGLTKRWKHTCENKKIRFHATTEDGFFQW